MSGGNIVTTILAIIAVAIVGYLLIHQQLRDYKEFDKYCDEKFGVDNWEMKDVTGEGKYKFYIGQAWECVENETTQQVVESTDNRTIVRKIIDYFKK